MTKKRIFLGQAVLILLPMLVLFAVGLNSLRQDKLLAHREAAEHADRLARSLLAESAATLAETGATTPEEAPPAFQVDAEGHLVFPPRVSQGLTPKPLALSVLSEEQARLWQTAQSSEARGNNSGATAEAYRDFLLLRPPSDFAANATYSLGLAFTARGDVADAVEQFKRLAEHHPYAATESGLSLQMLAHLKILELGTNHADHARNTLLDSLCSNIIHHPTLLTPALLRQAARAVQNSEAKASLKKWSQLWQQQEQARALYSAASPSLGIQIVPPSKNSVNNTADISAPSQVSPRAFWFTMNGVDANTSAQVWLAVRFQETSEGCWFRCLTESQVAAELNAMVTRVVPVRDYLGVELTLAQKTLVSPRKPDDVSTAEVESNPELLASASRAENGAEWLKASVFLTESAWLYAQQRSRRFWFGSLIVISGVAALTGLFANWRAFLRQQRLAELQSNFVSSVSHELRTPIAAVRLLVDGLESGKVSGPWKQRQYLRLISQECRRLAGLIENVLDYSRIERGQKQFEFEPTDVLALTVNTVRIVEPFAAERKVSLSLALPANQSANCNSHALIDGRAIEQALLNLIDNAIKHSPEGQTVTVGVDWADGGATAASNDQPNGGVTFWVEDHGDGIAPEEHEKIFERFYRLGSELRRESQGVGIGLSIVKHIVEGHGGRMSVRSVVGQGSRFTIELPANLPLKTIPHARR